MSTDSRQIRPRAPIRVCYPIRGVAVGGSHITLATLIKELDRSRFEPVVFLYETGGLSRFLDEREIPYRLLPADRQVRRGAGLRTLADLLRGTPGLASLLRREGIDLVHTAQNYCSQQWALACRLSGTSHLWVQAGPLHPSRLEGLLRRTATGVLVNTQYVRCAVDERLWPRCSVVPPPLDVEWAAPDRDQVKQALAAEIGVGPETRLVGFFGRLTEIKRPEVFVRAAGELESALPGRCAFLVFGQDRLGLQRDLQALGRSQGVSLHFLGFRGPGQYWMAGCDLLLVPSVGETFGRVLIEAMLAGTPVAASDSGGHGEVIEHGRTGLLAPPDDPTALAGAALALLHDDPLRTRIIKEAGLHARRHYSIGRYVSEIQGIYDRILKNHRRLH